MFCNPRICVIEYPRSGANWLLKMLSEYSRMPYRDLDKKPGSKTGKLLQEYLNIPPLARFNTQKRLNPFRYIEKTHVFDRIDSNSNKKIIYVIRDPRDVMISYYHYEKDFIRKVLKEKSAFLFDDNLCIKDELADYIKFRFQTNAFPYLKWSEHVQKALNDPRTLIIKYEDLLSSTYAQMIKAIEFLKLKINHNRIEDIVSYHSFEKEKRRLQDTKQEYSIHLRKGISGEWKDHFSIEMEQYMYLHCKKQMNPFGYDPPKKDSA